MNDVAIFMFLFGACCGVAITLLFMWACTGPFTVIAAKPTPPQQQPLTEMQRSEWWKNGISPDEFDTYK